MEQSGQRAWSDKTRLDNSEHSGKIKNRWIQGGKGHRCYRTRRSKSQHQSKKSGKRKNTAGNAEEVPIERAPEISDIEKSQIARDTMKTHKKDFFEAAQQRKADEEEEKAKAATAPTSMCRTTMTQMRVATLWDLRHTPIRKLHGM